MLKPPTPAEVKQLREAAELSRQEAAELVHAVDQDGKGSYRTWQNWELEPSSSEAREIPLAVWELFLRKLEERGRDPSSATAAQLLRGRRRA